MPEPNAPVDPNAGNVTDPEMVQIPKAELEGLKVGKQFYDSVQEKARDLIGEGYGAADYLEEIEITAKDALQLKEENEKLKGSQKPPEVKPNGNLPNAQPVIPAGLSEEDKQTIQGANKTATAAYFTAAYGEFLTTQSDLPKEERSKLGKMDLLKVINGPKQSLVAHLAANDPQFQGNAFVVADYLINESKEREARAKEGANRTTALDKARVTANIESTTVAPPADNKTKTENDKLADDIVPDDAPVVLT
jgi:hypothetical protein